MALLDRQSEFYEGGLGIAMLNDLLRSLPYQVHTGRELGLMLAGSKPLSYFIDVEGQFPAVMVRYFRLFDSHVDRGNLVRRDHFSAESGHRHHRILFALPGEEWRMQAMIELMTSFDAWTEYLERRQGELLGYQDWMNDYWVEFVYRRQMSL